MDDLVTTEWLAGELGSPGLTILDASWHMPAANRDARAEYEERHIPGARFFVGPSICGSGANVTPPGVVDGARRMPEPFGVFVPVFAPRVVVE